MVVGDYKIQALEGTLERKKGEDGERDGALRRRSGANEGEEEGKTEERRGITEREEREERGRLRRRRSERN